jgi:predicted ferric reductase
MEELILRLPDLERLGGDMLEHPYWYLGRSAGFIAYALLWGSVVLGLAVSSRVFDGMLGRPWVFELHRFLSVFVLIAIVFHALIMLPDPYAGFTVKDLLVPLASDYRTGPMALGIVSLYGLALVTGSFYVTKVIGQKTWRSVHYSTFGLCVLSTVHGIWTGTDSDSYGAQVMYLGAGVSVLFFTFYRVLALKSARKEQKRQPAARPAPAPKGAPLAALSPTAEAPRQAQGALPVGAVLQPAPVLDDWAPQ